MTSINLHTKNQHRVLNKSIDELIVNPLQLTVALSTLKVVESFPNHLAEGSADLQFCGPQPGTSKSYKTINERPVLHSAPVYSHAYTGTKLYCLATEADVCEHLAEGCIWQSTGSDWNRNLQSQVQCPNY